MNLPQTADTLVLRTDFSDDSAWDAVCDEIRRSECEGFIERYDCVSDRGWKDFPQERFLDFSAPPYFFMVVDAETIRHPEHPLLAVDLNPYSQTSREKRMFRLVPAQATGFACNLNISNMDFDEFAESADYDGIFRGFRS
jgi:hypothetical protein